MTNYIASLFVEPLMTDGLTKQRPMWRELPVGQHTIARKAPVSPWETPPTAWSVKSWPNPLIAWPVPLRWAPRSKSANKMSRDI